MELRQIRHFVAVAEHAHFTRAAESMHLSQSALSSSVRALEGELGSALFERTTRSVLLTAAGKVFFPYAKRMLREAADAGAAVGRLRTGEAGTLALGTVQTFTAVDLPALLARLHSGYPGIEVTLREATTAELFEAVAAGELDLAFVALDARPLPAGLTALRSYTEELAVVVAPSHPLSASDDIDLAGLQAYPFVDFQAGTGLQTTIESLFVAAGVNRRITFRVSDIDRVLELVRHGLGVAIVPDTIARRSGLRRIRVRPNHPRRILALVGRVPAPTTVAAEHFLELLAASSSAVPTGGQTGE